MAKKKIVSAEWHERAMKAIESEEEMTVFINGLQAFLCTKLSPEQQRQLEEEIVEWIEINAWVMYAIK